MILWCGRLMTGNVAVWAARTTEVIVDVATNRWVFTTIVGTMLVAAWGPWWVFPIAVAVSVTTIGYTAGWSAADHHRRRQHIRDRLACPRKASYDC